MDAQAERDLLKVIIANTSGNILLVGPPGVGKTSIVEWLAHTQKQPVLWTANCTPDMSAGQIVGHPKIIDDGTGEYYAKGPAIQAWERGELLLIDDLHKISGDAEAELLTIGNDVSWSHKVLPNGEVVRPLKTFRMFGTMNGIAEELDPAMRERFEKVILVRCPSTEMLDRLDGDVRAICEQAYAACDALAGGLPRFSYRECRAFCRSRNELKAALDSGHDEIPSDTDERQLLAAMLALGSDPTRAEGFMRLVKLAQAEDPDAE